MKLYLILCILLCFLSCQYFGKKEGKSIITVQLPFESANYYHDTNFVLYDSLGRKCIPVSDTVTWGGGTIEYEDLPSGTYTYMIRTVFNDTIRKAIKIDSSRSIPFYKECYDVREAIELDVLQNCKTIHLIIDTIYESESSNGAAFKIEKNDSIYSLTYILDDGKGWSKPSLIDSSAVIRALAEFEFTLIGLSKMGMHERKNVYFPPNTVYLKCDNQFLLEGNIKKEYFEAAVLKFKKAVIKG